MIKLFIKKHVAKLTKEDIIHYAKQNGIVLDNIDVNTIYNYIKTKYETILYNENQTLKDIDNLLKTEQKSKIKELYLLYRNKYKNYL